MKACLLLVRDIPMHENAWEGQHMDKTLVEAMQPWLSGEGCPASVYGFPDDFLFFSFFFFWWYVLRGATQQVI